MSWLLVPWLQGHLIMHEPALILFQTGFHISTQITILHPMSKSKVRGSYMKTKIRKDQLTKEEMEVFKNKNCKLLSSKQLAELLHVTEGAIRKQRSKDRSLFPYAK